MKILNLLICICYNSCGHRLKYIHHHQKKIYNLYGNTNYILLNFHQPWSADDSKWIEDVVETMCDAWDTVLWYVYWTATPLYHKIYVTAIASVNICRKTKNWLNHVKELTPSCVRGIWPDHFWIHKISSNFGIRLCLFI